jgi:hypothetical protein
MMPKYKHLLSIVVHEYFQLLVEKRLRPAKLGLFDYEEENCPTMCNGSKEENGRTLVIWSNRKTRHHKQV